MQGSSYAPLQFLRSPWNRDVYTAIDNQIDGRTVLVLYLGAASTLPSELQKYNVGCVLIHKDEKQIYLNTGNDVTPTWESFGPGTNTLPTPFIAGYVLTNDGTDAFWSLVDLATMVTGLLDSDNIDLSDLANNSDFIDALVGNAYFTSSLANDSNFISELLANATFISDLITTLLADTDFINGIDSIVTDIINNSLTPIGTGVKVDSSDTTSGYLDDKISLTSTDGSVTITKTINNPAGNEDIEYDLSANGSLSVLTVNDIDDFTNVVKTAADGSTERGVSGNFIIEQTGGADPAYVALGSSETNHPGIVDLTVSNGAELYGFTNADSGFTSLKDRTIPVGNDFNFSGLFRSTRPGGSFDSIFGLSLDGIGFGIYVRFNSATSATKVLFYDGSVQTTTAINLPTSNTWTSFEIDWNVGTSTLVFKIGGVTVYSGTPTFTGSHIGFSAGSVGGTAGTKLSFDYITTTYTVTR